MLGAVIGDIVGSRFEWHNIRSKEFALFHEDCTFTDDTVMTCAVAQAILDWDEEKRPSWQRLSQLSEKNMRELGKIYPDRGYGGNFGQWLYDESMGPYYSCGNGSAMRIFPVGWAADSLESCIAMSHAVTAITHNHPDGIMGAEATAVQIFLARSGYSLSALQEYEEEHYYPLEHDLVWLQDNYRWSSLCDGTCQSAYVCLYESKDYEGCIRNCMSIGGDSDTIGAIAGGIAETCYGIPENLVSAALRYLPDELITIYNAFTQRFIPI